MFTVLRKYMRGTKRKCNKMIAYINEATNTFPDVDLIDGYWHVHLLGEHDFIDSANVPIEARKLIIQTLIDRGRHLISIKPKLGILTRVVVCINLPKLSDSQIIVFFADKHYNDFFKRENQKQKWIPLPATRSLKHEYKLNIPFEMDEKGYKEEIVYLENSLISELWFFGEL